MKIQKLNIKSFRGLKDITLDALTRVNYVIGKNNSGKTSVLEAIVTGGCYSDINMLIDTVFARSQKRFLEGAKNMLISRKNLNTEIDIQYDDGHTIETVVSCTENEKIVQNEKRVQNTRLLTINFDCRDVSLAEDKKTSFWINFEQSGKSTTLRKDPSIAQKNLRIIPCQFISFSRFDTTDKILEALDSIFVKNQRDSLIRVLKIFDPTVVNFEVVGEERQILVLKEGEDQIDSLYLNDYGNGMYKAFYIACAALLAENGMLLIDELEAGIHHTALEEFVGFLEQISIDKNIQLFVTTHSLELLDVSGKIHKGNEMNVYNIKRRETEGETTVKLIKKNDFDYLRNELGVDIR